MKKETRTNIKGRVARILFNDPNGALTKYRVAKMAESRYAWIHRLLKQLEEQGLVHKTKVRNFKSLMDWWIRWQPKPKYREYQVKNPLELLRRSNLKYALTTYQAENRIQSYLFPSRTDFYIHAEDMQKWHELLTEDGLVGGGNTRLLVGDDHVFYKQLEVDGLTLASIPQIIFDLYNENVFGVEAADMLLEKVERDAMRKL